MLKSVCALSWVLMWYAYVSQASIPQVFLFWQLESVSAAQPDPFLSPSRMTADLQFEGASAEDNIGLSLESIAQIHLPPAQRTYGSSRRAMRESLKLVLRSSLHLGPAVRSSTGKPVSHQGDVRSTPGGQRGRILLSAQELSLSSPSGTNHDSTTAVGEVTAARTPPSEESVIPSPSEDYSFSPPT
ncbi:hypothetical protein Mapa_008211 [Marchantia paleacea]|nr:hypothetical protein Mapa_008211 [Marchantia paleacea]